MPQAISIGRQLRRQSGQRIATEFAMHGARHAGIQLQDHPVTMARGWRQVERRRRQQNGQSVRQVMVAWQAVHGDARVAQQGNELAVAAGIVLHQVAGQQQRVGGR